MPYTEVKELERRTIRRTEAVLAVLTVLALISDSPADDLFPFGRNRGTAFLEEVHAANEEFDAELLDELTDYTMATDALGSRKRTRFHMETLAPRRPVIHTDWDDGTFYIHFRFHHAEFLELKRLLKVPAVITTPHRYRATGEEAFLIYLYRSFRSLVIYRERLSRLHSAGTLAQMKDEFSRPIDQISDISNAFAKWVHVTSHQGPAEVGTLLLEVRRCDYCQDTDASQCVRLH
jgi:hypothetical protein